MTHDAITLAYVSGNYLFLSGVSTANRITVNTEENRLGEDNLCVEVKTMVNCPKCGYPQYCGCPACLPRVPKGIMPEIPNPDGETVSCVNCGYTQTYDGWLAIYEEQTKAVRR